MLKIIVIIIASIAALGLLVFAGIFINMIFIGKITEFKLLTALESKALLNDITIREISNNEKPWPQMSRHERSQSTGDLKPAKEMVVFDNGQLTSERRAYDSSPGKEVFVLHDEQNNPQLIFRRNKVFKVKDGQRGDLLGYFSDPKVTFVRHVSALDEKYFLLIGDPSTVKYPYSYLWQVDKANLKKTKIAEDLYFVFEKPPMIFKPKGFEGIIVIYYTGSVDYGFGGDSSRPEFSHIRIYNDQFTNGTDIAKFGFKAGTIVDVKWSNGALILTGDPSRPLSAEMKPKQARVWEIKF